MKKINVSEIPLPIIVIAGVLASALSFFYYFALKNPYEIIFWLICIIDFFLFIINAYLVIEPFDLSKAKTIFFTILTMLLFFAFCQFVVWWFTDGTRFEYNLELFFDVLRFSLFLSPLLILLLPVIVFIGECIS